MHETLHLLRAWLRDPRSVGALAPSGAELARLMTRHIDAAHGPVIELGPGTGVFTRILLDSGMLASQLALVEADPVLAAKLAQAFPQVRVLCMDAAELGRMAPLFGGQHAGVAVSGLPLLSIPAPKVAAIVQGLFERQLRAGGALYQFTYGPRCPLPDPLLRRLGLVATRTGRAWRNLPPAAVYRIEREHEASVAA